MLALEIAQLLKSDLEDEDFDDFQSEGSDEVGDD